MNKLSRSAGRRTVSIAAFAAALIAAAPATAQETGWTKYNFGLQASALTPTGDSLKNVAGTGFGLAGYAEKVWSTSWALRGRLEYIAFGEKNYGSDAKTSVNQTGVMLDLIYYMGLRDVVYPFAGVGYFNRSATLNVTGVGGDFSVPIDSELAFCLGVGWNFTPHLGVELKYSQCESAWFQASLLYRF